MGRLAEGALRRHRLITVVSLGFLVLIAWAWLASGAGMGTGARYSLLPQSSAAATDGMVMGSASSGFTLVFSMWLVMMAAMMLPSAAPTVLLYARAAAHRAPPDTPAPSTGLFVTGYLLVWSAFSALAALLHLRLEASGLVTMDTMGLASRALSGGLLIATGIYQFTPPKGACLAHCRSPAEFLARHFRPGSAGALRLGLVHGAYCFGCCWVLMLLLFVGGVMNLAWIAALAILVAAEKLLPWGRAIARVTGVGLVAAGAALLIL